MSLASPRLHSVNPECFRDWHRRPTIFVDGHRRSLQQMRTAVALGSNLGDRLENLRAARRQITELHRVQPPILSSGIYETEPVDCEAGALKFLNAVVEFDYEG